MKYAVEIILLNNSWENVWHDGEGKPTLFGTREEAEGEIRDHIIGCINAVEAGDMEDSPDPTEFRVVPVGGPMDAFDDFEIHGCRRLNEHGHTWVEQCPDKEAEFFTLFGHIRSGGVEAIGDFKTSALAEEVLVRLNPPVKAAAFELLTALEYFFNIMHDYSSSRRKGYVKSAMQQARDAIAKAKAGAL